MHPETVTLSSSRHVQELPCGHEPFLIAISTEGRHVAVATLIKRDEQKIEVWDVHASHRVQCGTSDEQVTAIAFSHDDKNIIVVPAEGTIRHLNIDSGKWIDGFRHHFSYIDDAVFSPKSQFVALQSDSDQFIVDLADERHIQSIRNGNSPRFSPDENLLITHWSRYITLWKLGHDDPIWTVSVDLRIRDVAFFGDEQVAFLCLDEPNIIVRATKDGSEIFTLPCGEHMQLITWLGNGLGYMGLSGDEILIHEETGRDCIKRLSIPSSACFQDGSVEKEAYTFCHTAQSVAWCGHSAVHLWDMNIPMSGLGGSTPHDLRDPCTGVVLAPGTSDELLLVAPHYDAMTVWSRRDGKILSSILDNERRYDQHAFFSPTGRYVTVKNDKERKWGRLIFDTKHGLISGRLQSICRQSICADFSANGDCIAFALGNEGVQVWELATQDLTASIPRHASMVKFSHSSQFLAIVDGRHIEIWSFLSPAQCLQTINFQDKYVSSVAFSLDDKCLVIASIDHVHIWHLDSNKASRELRWSHKG